MNFSLFRREGDDFYQMLAKMRKSGGEKQAIYNLNQVKENWRGKL